MHSAVRKTERLFVVDMSLLAWLKNGPKNTDPLLPDAEKEESEEKRAEVVAANIAVRESIRAPRKRRCYHHYEGETRAKIGRYAAEHGNKAAINKFSCELEHKIDESTVRNFKRQYLQQLKVTPDPNSITVLETRPRGRPTLLTAKMESALIEYLRKLRLKGGIVNKLIVISAAQGIIEYYDRSVLKKYGGSLELTRTWAESFMHRMGLSKRKGTKAARKLPDDFAAIRVAFLERIRFSVQEHKIPADLVLNWDQTGVRLVPVSEWTMAETGSKQVEIRGFDDKREITVLLTITLSGKLLPFQLIYPGKTDRCHPKQTFPVDWDVYHSVNHWSNEDTMLHYIENVLVPYVTQTRKSLGLPESQRALAIFDVFAAHRVERVLQALEDANIAVQFVPAGCTGELQPLDKSINEPFKRELKMCFTEWYADKVKVALDQKSDSDVDLRSSVMKEVHSNWLIKVHGLIAKKPELIRDAFRLTGIQQYAGLEP